MTRRPRPIYLVVAQRLPKGKKRCRETHHASMSIVMMRQFYKAIMNWQKEDTRTYIQMRNLAFDDKRPLFECIDVAPNASEAIKKAKNKRYRGIFLLGRKVEKVFASSVSVLPKSVVLGFPTGRNEEMNIDKLWNVTRNDRTLKKQMESIIQTVKDRTIEPRKRP